MNRICIDTSAYSNFMRGCPSCIELISSARDVSIPVIVLGELRTGFKLGIEERRNERELEAFLFHPATRVLNVDNDASMIYAEIVAELRSSGTPLPTNDIWIAALAAREGATVVSYDHHFCDIKRIGKCLLE